MRGMVFLVALMIAEFGAGGSTDPLTFVGFNQKTYNDYAGDLAVSPDGTRVYVAALNDDAVSVFTRDPATNELTWRSAVRAADLAPLILEEPAAVEISPDGGHVYVAAANGLAVFETDSNGDLTFLEVYRDGEGGLTTLEDPRGVSVSPDNKHVYVTARGDNSLTAFACSQTTGLLTSVGSYTDGIGGVDGLGAAGAVAISPNGQNVYVASLDDDALAVFDRNSVTGQLTFLDVYKDSDIGIDGLDGPYDVEVSVDGANVYVSAFDDKSVTVFDRDSVSGLLALRQVVVNGVAGASHLDMVAQLAGSPDGQHLYVVDILDDAVTVFFRSPANGALSQAGVIEAGVGELGHIDVPLAVIVPGDGSGVIVGTHDNGIISFARDPSTGLLSHVETEFSSPGLDGPVGITANHDPCVLVAGNYSRSVQGLTPLAPGGRLLPTDSANVGVQGVTGTRAVATTRTDNHIYVAGHDTDEIAVVDFVGSNPCELGLGVGPYTNGFGGIHGLDGPQHLALSPDELHLYVASQIDNAVAIFSRDPENLGALTFIGAVYDGVGTNDGLDGAYWVEVSPDGAFLYAAGYNDDAIAVFARNPSTGNLTFASLVRDGEGVVDGLDGVSSLAISPDGKHLYAAGRLEDSLAMFARSPSVGALIYLNRLQDGVGGVDGLDGARAVAVSPDGRQVYVASQYDDALAVFSRNPVTGLLTQVGLHRDGLGGVDGLDTANGVAVSPDGMQVYVTGFGENAVATFFRSDVIIFSDSFESGNTSVWSSAVGAP